LTNLSLLLLALAVLAASALIGVGRQAYGFRGASSK